MQGCRRLTRRSALGAAVSRAFIDRPAAPCGGMAGARARYRQMSAPHSGGGGLQVKQ